MLYHSYGNLLPDAYLLRALHDTAIFRQDHAVATRKNLQGAQCVKLCRQMDEAALLRFLIALHCRAKPLRTVIQQQPFFVYIIDR